VSLKIILFLKNFKKNNKFTDAKKIIKKSTKKLLKRDAIFFRLVVSVMGI